MLIESVELKRRLECEKRTQHAILNSLHGIIPEATIKLIKTWQNTAFEGMLNIVESLEAE